MAQLIEEHVRGDASRFWLGDMHVRVFCCSGGHGDARGAVRCAYERSSFLRLYGERGSELTVEQAISLCPPVGLKVISKPPAVSHENSDARSAPPVERVGVA